MGLQYNMTTEQVKVVLCKHCDLSYPATKDNFYTSYGKLKLDICKECKKERSRQNEKTRKPRDRKEYMRNRKKYMREYQRKYRLKKKLEKLEASKNSNEN